MYEVLRFVDQGADCRQTIDCLEGKLLIYYLQEQQEIEKQRLWELFRQICVQIDKYQKSSGGQNYRCLTPYSILVSEEGEVLLLNLKAEENEFVIRRMQQKAVRKHFQQPADTKELSSIRKADVFGIGKIMQFVLACAEPIPELTRAEERKMTKIIERCVGRGKNSYDEIHQVIKDLPTYSQKHTKGEKRSQFKPGKIFLAAGIVACGICILVFLSCLKRQIWKAEGDSKTDVPKEKVEKVTQEEYEPLLLERQDQDEMKGENIENNVEKKLQILSDVKNLLEEDLLSNTKEGNEEVLLTGKELELYTVRALASAYEREEQTDEAIQAYGRLVEIEERQEMIILAGVRKMKLEAGREQYAKAVLTGEQVLEKTDGAEEVERLMEEYQNQAEGKEKADAEENQTK